MPGRGPSPGLACRYPMDDRPLDAVLRARLHLPEGSGVRLNAIRGVLSVIDGIARTVSGRPLFALRETEDLMRRLGGLTGAAVPRRILELNGGTEILAHGLGHVPPSGAVVVASTHPTGMLDFIAHAGALLDRRPDLKVVANQEVEVFLGPELIVPVRIDKVNRAISGDRVFRGMQEHLDRGGALLIFGSGRVPRQVGGRLVEPAWRSGASRISQACQVPVVPAAINARNSGRYHALRRLGQLLGGGDDHFGAMVGSLRYPAELIERLGGRIEVHYGAPLAPGTAPDRLKRAAEGLVSGLYAGS